MDGWMEVERNVAEGRALTLVRCQLYHKFFQNIRFLDLSCLNRVPCPPPGEMAGVGPSRREALSLYRTILQMHRKKLPRAQREIGDRVRPLLLSLALPQILHVMRHPNLIVPFTIL